jgi:hypothetical protein
LKTITSMSLVVSRTQWAWLARHTELGDLEGDTRLLAMAMWVRWNRLCQARSTWTYRIEDFSQLWPRMLMKLGLRPGTVPAVSKELHRAQRWAKPFVDREAIKKQPDLTWGELTMLDAGLAAEARLLAEEYGYV